jgi:L-ascorbate metabolism protein UlaG (beta-lactamase superfamily)
VIIASHRHRDHYHAGLHRWLVERLAPADSAVFVLGLDEQDPSPAWAADSPLTRLVRPNEAHPLGPDGWMATIQSTDQGVALLIDFPEISLYFGGDLALWADEPFYHKQHATSLARLASLLAEARPANGWLPRRPVDLAFVPVCTSDGYQEPALTEGALSTVRLLDPKHLFPMHGRTFEALYDRFASTLAHRSPDFAGTVHVAHQPGDLFAVELQNSRQESHHGQ